MTFPAPEPGSDPIALGRLYNPAVATPMLAPKLP
jgi:hypothetical protein